MSLDDSGDYELLKIALLNRYRLTDANFRNKSRQAKPQDGESFSQFGIRITGYLDRWIELSETSLSYEGIRDLLIREQTLGVGSAELRVFIEERTPGSFKEMCNIAEQYLKAHGKSFRHWWMSDKHRSEGHETKGLNSEIKNRLSNATSKFHGRSGQARVNGRVTQLLDVLVGYVAPSSIMLESVLKTSLIGLCNQVKARSGEMRQCSHAKKLCYSREG